MEAFEPKPTYEEQLAWLETIKLLNPEMIKVIKENVIAARNYEKAIEKELDPRLMEIADAFNDLVAIGDAEVRSKPMVVEILTFDSESAELNQAIDNIDNFNKFKAGQDPSDRNLNLQWEHSVINNRIQKLQAELSHELSLKKKLRSHQVIDHCHKSINNLKKWKSQSL